MSRYIPPGVSPTPEPDPDRPMARAPEVDTTPPQPDLDDEDETEHAAQVFTLRQTYWRNGFRLLPSTPNKNARAATAGSPTRIRSAIMGNPLARGRGTHPPGWPADARGHRR